MRAASRRRRARGAPQLGERLVEHPARRSRTISPVSSATGMNPAGSTRPRLRVLPAQQRLGADDAAVGEARRPAGRAARARRARAPGAARSRGRGAPRPVAAARWLEQLDAVAAEVLGPVHRGVGVAEQLLGATAGRRPGRCRCWRSTNSSRPAQRDRLARAPPSMRSANSTASLRVGDVFAARSRTRRRRSGATVSAGRSERGEPLARPRTSSSSPTTWPEAVVDQLEAVEVEEQHRDVAAGALGACQRVREAVDEQQRGSAGR